MKTIRVVDGEDFNVIAELGATVADPLREVPAVAQMFRVVANSFGPTLKLVAVCDGPVKLASLPEEPKVVYTVPLHCGQTVEVPRGTRIMFYDPESL